MNTNKLKLAQTKEILNTVYSTAKLTRKISLNINEIGENILQTLENKIKEKFEGRCVKEGFIKPGSSKIISYSSALIERGIDNIFQVIFDCLLCTCSNNMQLYCIVKMNNKAGIIAESATDFPSPIYVFIVRDHEQKTDLNIGDKITVSVKEVWYGLDDTFIYVIGNLIRKDGFYNKKQIAGSNHDNLDYESFDTHKESDDDDKEELDNHEEDLDNEE